MRDVVGVLITVDRSPQTNYLQATLDNLHRSGPCESSTRLLRLVIVDHGPGLDFAHKALMKSAMAGDRSVALTGPPPPEPRTCANENVVTALRVGARAGVPWVLFMEDDIDVCGNFFDSVAAWLDEHATQDYHVYAIGNPLPHDGPSAVKYAVTGFYGTQCFALRSEDAEDLARYIERDYYQRGDGGAQWDLIMQSWALGRWPEQANFLAASPSFVEHIGRSSIVNPRKSTHKFQSWPGRDWSYVERAEVSA